MSEPKVLNGKITAVDTESDQVQIETEDTAGLTLGGEVNVAVRSNGKKQSDDDYKRFGEEWRKEMEKFEQKGLIDFCRTVCLELDKVRSKLNQLKGVHATDRPDLISDEILEKYFWEI